jgi:hypothetical protein
MIEDAQDISSIYEQITEIDYSLEEEAALA